MVKKISERALFLCTRPELEMQLKTVPSVGGHVKRVTADVHTAIQGGTRQVTYIQPTSCRRQRAGHRTCKGRVLHFATELNLGGTSHKFTTHDDPEAKEPLVQKRH